MEESSKPLHTGCRQFLEARELNDICWGRHKMSAFPQPPPRIFKFIWSPYLGSLTDTVPQNLNSTVLLQGCVWHWKCLPPQKQRAEPAFLGQGRRIWSFSLPGAAPGSAVRGWLGIIVSSKTWYSSITSEQILN